ncbi:MAG TPA: SPFH domain-containing protein, partial [Aggregatilineales bacterium]|nr:SPFH domain-containing protein [Aggregatilineales bacterium]
PGIAIINPITTSYRRYDVSFQNYTMSSTFDEGQVQGDDAVQTRTSGGQLVSIELTMIYRLDPGKVNLIHVNWPNESYQDDFVRSLLRSAVRDAVSLFSIESVIQERDSIDTQIETLVIPAMEEQGFFVEDILLRNIAFTDEYAASIEAAQMAEVRAREEEFRVEQFEQQAEQVQVRARGEAEARKITAEAEALALQLIADVLRENPQLLEYEYIQKLSDNVTVLALPANNPFIFDLQSFMNTLPEPSSDTNDSQSLIPTPEPENQNN